MTKVTTKKKLAVLGNGFLAGIIVETFNKGLLEEYELTGILILDFRHLLCGIGGGVSLPLAVTLFLNYSA